MYLHYRPTKADLIRGILDNWDPCRKVDTDRWYNEVYRYK